MSQDVIEAHPLQRDAIIWDPENQKSVLNIIPPRMRKQAETAKETRPDLFQYQDEHSLWHNLKKAARPTPTDNRLRIAFWMEYDRVQAGFRHKMDMTHVYGGVCSSAYFSDYYCIVPEKLCWLLTPPASYMIKMNEALDFGVDVLRNILSLDNVTEDGKPNVKLMELQAKIVAMLDARKNGAFTQKIEQKSMHLNVDVPMGQVKGATMEETMRLLEERIEKLQKQDRLARVPEPKTVDILTEATVVGPE